MHEATVAREIAEVVTRAAAGQLSRVCVIRLQIGAFSCIQDDLLRLAFDVAARDTVAQGARLEIDRIPARAWCERCGRAYPVWHTETPCPHCGGRSRSISGGREALVQEIEGD